MDATRRVLALLLAVYAIFSGGHALGSISLTPTGVATVTVSLHAILGMVAGIALIVNWHRWHTLMLIWIIVLIPVVAVDQSGSLTRSLVALGFTWFSTTTRQMGFGPPASLTKVVTHRAFGINLIGLLLLVCYAAVVRVSSDRLLALQAGSPPHPRRRAVVFSIALMSAAVTLAVWIHLSGVAPDPRLKELLPGTWTRIVQHRINSGHGWEPFGPALTVVIVIEPDGRYQWPKMGLRRSPDGENDFPHAYPKQGKYKWVGKGEIRLDGGAEIRPERIHIEILDKDDHWVLVPSNTGEYCAGEFTRKK